MNYKIYLDNKLEISTLDNAYEILILNPHLYNEIEISQIKERGYKVLAYMSIGSIEQENPLYSKYKKFELGKRSENNGFFRLKKTNEVYVNVGEREWRSFLVEEAKKLKEKNFDGWLLDGLDVYTYAPTSKIFVACAAVIGRIKKLGGYVMVNGGDKFFERAIDQDISLAAVDGIIQKEVLTRIVSYKGKEKFSRQKKGRKEFLEEILRKLRKRGLEVYLFEFARNEEMREEVKKWCVSNKAGYYICE